MLKDVMLLKGLKVHENNINEGFVEQRKWLAFKIALSINIWNQEAIWECNVMVSLIPWKKLVRKYL